MNISVRKTEMLFEFIRVIVALLIAYALVLVCIALMFDDPLQCIYYFMLGPFSSLRKFGNLIARFIPYLFTGCGMCFCYASRRFNLAGEGGFMISGCIVAMAAIAWGDLGIPHVLIVAILILIGAICSGLTTSVPAVLREKLGTNEVVISLMLNCVLLYVTNYILKTYMQDLTINYRASALIPESTKLATLVSRTDIHTGLIIGLVLVAVTAVVFYRTSLGTAIRICGSNPFFAKYAGIKMTSSLIIAQVLGGMITGMGGAIEILGNYDRFQWTALTQYGFDGLMVAVLARKNPLFVPFGAFILAYMKIGANNLNYNTSVPIEFVQVMQAVLILLVAAETFMSKQKNSIIFRAAKNRLQKEENNA